MPFAPSVRLAHGQVHIPQHYLSYRHNVQSLAEVISDIQFDAHTLLFAAQDQHGMYVQVGLLGRENYERTAQLRPRKLVYGRKWRIDADTPTSEIVQTAYLAIKKAREHEVRELLTLQDAATGKISCPFSSHLDLHALVASADTLADTPPHDHLHSQTERLLAAYLAPLRFAQRVIHVRDVLPRFNGTTLVDLQLGVAPLARQAEGDLGEFDQLAFSVLWRGLDAGELAYEIMNAMIQHSDRFVDEHFSYRGVFRFSRKHSPARLAALSLATRPYARDRGNARFMAEFEQRNFAVDASRAPAMGSGALAQRNQHRIDACQPLAGHMPQGYRLPTPAQSIRANA